MKQYCLSASFAMRLSDTLPLVDASRDEGVRYAYQQQIC